jgi:hypothetical protein
MIQRATPAADWRKCARRVAWIVALGALLAGCDSCGDWWWSSPGPGDAQVCRNAGPKPR